MAHHEAAAISFISGLFWSTEVINSLHMAQADAVTPTDASASFLPQLLKAALQQAQREQPAARPRMNDVLTELGYILEDQIKAIANAVEDDKADAEMAGAWAD
jgi:hypothetical protein